MTIFLSYQKPRVGYQESSENFRRAIEPRGRYLCIVVALGSHIAPTFAVFHLITLALTAKALRPYPLTRNEREKRVPVYPSIPRNVLLSGRVRLLP